MNPPFLELSFYVGAAGVRPTLEALVKDLPPGELPGRLPVPNLVGLSEGEEIEVYGGIVVLRTEGGAFCGPAGTKLRRAKTLGRRVYERFVDVADMIPCVYGAILIEYSLEDPGELRRDPRSLAFRSFFLSEKHLGRAAVEQAVSLAARGAFVEKRSAGMYVSTSSWFSPEGAQVDSLEAQERSAMISAVVGLAAR